MNVECLPQPGPGLNVNIVLKSYTFLDIVPFATFKGSSDQKTEQVSSTAVLKHHILGLHHNTACSVQCTHTHTHTQCYRGTQEEHNTVMYIAASSPGSLIPAFQCCTQKKLKSWEEPGDKASNVVECTVVHRLHIILVRQYIYMCTSISKWITSS